MLLSASEKVVNTVLTDQKDRFSWKNNKEGIFTVKSMYKLLFLLCGTFWKMRKGVAEEKENEGRGMVHGVQKKNRKRC